MPTLLHIDASPRGEYSLSRALSAAYAEAWKAKNPDGKVIRRDLTTTPLSFVDLDWIVGAFSSPEQHAPEHKEALALSDELVGELLEADSVVLGTPMYNFSLPAVTKAWVDHIVRVGKTFTIDDKGVHGLAAGRKFVVMAAAGSNYGPGALPAEYNVLTPQIKTVLGFIGIPDAQVIVAGGTNPVTQGQLSKEDFIQPFLAQVQAAV